MDQRTAACRSAIVCMCVCIYVWIKGLWHADLQLYVCVCAYMCVYIYRESMQLYMCVYI